MSRVACLHQVRQSADEAYAFRSLAVYSRRSLQALARKSFIYHFINSTTRPLIRKFNFVTQTLATDV